MTDKALLPCPFCGEKAESYADSLDALVVCEGCGIQGSPRDTEADAIEAWNTRALASSDRADLVRRVEELEAENARLSDILDVERYKVAIGAQAVAHAVQDLRWLSQPGRGSYAYDEERYQQEFGTALTEIEAALRPLQEIAHDRSDCPRDPLRIAANRDAACATLNKEQSNDPG